MPRVVSWFSCGAASAYAAYLAHQKYRETETVYCRVVNEHPDNLDFCSEFSEKTGIKVKTIINKKFHGDIFEVFLYFKFFKNQYGAPCTLNLKKRLRESYQRLDDVQVFGYTIEEQKRADKFIDANIDVYADFILIDKGISKKECLEFIQDLGIRLPAMYTLGYKNNNCIGCVKGGMGYWNKIRVDFPEQFDKMAKAERLLGYALNKDKNGQIYLDELDPNRGHALKDAPGDCGFTCETKD